MKNKTLKEFLKKHKACEDSYLFAKDLTLEEFLSTCNRSDWILWLFAKMNPKSLKELMLAKGHCAIVRDLIIRDLMINDDRSLEAVDAAIAFGEGRATKQKLEDAACAAAAGAANAVSDAACAAAVAQNAVEAFYASDAANAVAYDGASADVFEAAYNAAYAAAYDDAVEAAVEAVAVAAACAAAVVTDAADAFYAVDAYEASYNAAYAAADAADAAAYVRAFLIDVNTPDANATSAKKASQKQIANMCRECLPLEIWDQSKI